MKKSGTGLLTLALALCLLLPPGCGFDDAEQVLIPEGAFLMGYDFGNPDEGPMRVVSLSSYYIDRYEVTNRRYAGCVESGRCRKGTEADNGNLNKARQPVLGVNWKDAEAFCRFRGRRLPTEAEWEKAARGSDGRLYPWGFIMDQRRANGSSKIDGFAFSSPVGSFPEGAGPYGVMDMAGNAKEWVADWYGADAYATQPARDPKGPETGSAKVVRGGSWKNDQLNVRTTLRNPVPPDAANEYFGFRCAADGL